MLEQNPPENTQRQGANVYGIRRKADDHRRRRKNNLRGLQFGRQIHPSELIGSSYPSSIPVGAIGNRRNNRRPPADYRSVRRVGNNRRRRDERSRKVRNTERSTRHEEPISYEPWTNEVPVR